MTVAAAIGGWYFTVVTAAAVCGYCSFVAACGWCFADPACSVLFACCCSHATTAAMGSCTHLGN